MKRIAVVVLMFVSVAACGQATPTATPTATPRTVASIAVPSPSPPPTQEPPLASLLPPGQYLVAARYGQEHDGSGAPISSLHVISLDGQDMGVLAAGVGVSAELSPDMNRIAYWRYFSYPGSRLSILSLRDGSQTDLPGNFRNAVGHVWSSTGDQIAVDVDGRVELVDIASGSRRLLLDCPQTYDGAHCFVQSWSPDGRWIAFALDFTYSAPMDPRNGLYLMEASCLADPTGCAEAIRGPLLLPDSQVAWSPDSRTFAVGYPYEIALYDVQVWSRSRSLQVEGVGSWHGLAWSPDGEWLAYSDDATIWLISPITGERRLVSSGPVHTDAVVFWLTIPDAHHQ